MMEVFFFSKWKVSGVQIKEQNISERMMIKKKCILAKKKNNNNTVKICTWQPRPTGNIKRKFSLTLTFAISICKLLTA